MASITIPKILHVKKLSFDNSGDESRGWINLCDDFQTRINRILEEVSAEFFPTYTDHGIKHINNVLKYAAKLIDKRTLEHLDAKSICALIMAILAHDIGMFIPYGGLRVILAEESWAKRWEEYRRELGHMSDSRAQEIFGTYHRGSRNLELPEAVEIVNAENKLIDDDWKKLLCGEFMRRFHHELAEYCVQNGFPLNRENTMQLIRDDVDEQDVGEAVALLARSHGEHMDDNDRLIEKTGQTTKASPGFVYGVPIYLLMAAIRIADYLDAGAERASWIRLAASGTDSKASINEFKWNQFIDINEKSFKLRSKCISITVRKKYGDAPITGTTFQRIEHWMDSVQRELDISWRYLYLKYEAEEQLYKLSAKMLISNIMENESRRSFAEDIVLEPASLSAAPEVLGLLVEPLYGSNPRYGVRELLQNAVDACREREALESGYKGKVKVIVDTRSKTPSFRMIDNGIGMTKEVILKYFLKVGSSYRNSDEWKNKFEGRSVERTGRFGIGVLAAFLLGEEVSVATLPKGEERGYVFSIKKDEYKPIDIAKAGSEDERIEKLLQTGGGTIIDIVPNAKAVETLSNADTRRVNEDPYGWYFLSDPEVAYEVDDNIMTAKERVTNWLVLGEFEEDKLKKQDELGVSFKWSDKHASWYNCFCNGFAVGQLFYQSGSFFFVDFWHISPTVFVTDVKNKAMLALDRNTLYLDDEIAAMLDEELFMLALAKAMIARIDTITGVPFYALSRPFAFIRPSEIMFDVPYLAAKSGINTAFVCIEDRADAWINILDNGQLDWSATPLLLSKLSRNKRILIDSGIEVLAIVSKSRGMADDLIGHTYSSKWCRKYNRDIYYASGKDVHFTFEESIVKEVAENEAVLGAMHFDFSASFETPKKIKAILDKYFELDSKDPWIPFELSERIKKFPRFFDKNDIMYKKYMDYLDKAKDHDRYYSLDEVEAARKKAEASRKE